jgi:hypothetical protein
MKQWVVIMHMMVVSMLFPCKGMTQELIANADLQVSEISRTQARLLFTMRLQQWPDNQPVKVFVLADTDPIHVNFAKRMLQLFPYQLRRVWDRQVFSGTGQAPITVATEKEMIERVAATPGALGYVNSAASLSGVKQIAIY